MPATALALAVKIVQLGKGDGVVAQTNRANHVVEDKAPMLLGA